jgi:hypothetical protein
MRPWRSPIIAALFGRCVQKPRNVFIVVLLWDWLLWMSDSNLSGQVKNLT